MKLNAKIFRIVAERMFNRKCHRFTCLALEYDYDLLYREYFDDLFNPHKGNVAYFSSNYGSMNNEHYNKKITALLLAYEICKEESQNG